MEVGDQYQISVHPNAGEPLITLPSRVVWLKPAGHRKHIIGLEFANLDDDKKRILAELARIVCDQIIFRVA